MVDEMRRQHRPYLYSLWEHDRDSDEQVPTVYRLKLKNAGDRVAHSLGIGISDTCDDQGILSHPQRDVLKTEPRDEDDEDLRVCGPR